MRNFTKMGERGHFNIPGYYMGLLTSTHSLSFVVNRHYLSGSNQVMESKISIRGISVLVTQKFP